MNIDYIIEVLCDGKKKEIEKVLEEYDISYSFDSCGEYTIKNGKTYEFVRGHGIFYPNCVKYFGKEYNMK